jgi:hypothetical protein
MSDPAIVSAIISGAVALAAVVSSTVFGVVTLHHQRKLEGERQGHERSMRLLDSTLQAAVDFLAAADQTTRARQALDMAQRTLSNAKSSTDQAMYDRFLASHDEARSATSDAIAEAERAYTSLRLLVPAVAESARRYLDLCTQANVHPDETKVDRERARQMAEQAIRTALDKDSPTARVLAESSKPKRRLSLRRGRQ